MLILGLFFGDFRGFLRPCEAMRQIKVKFWFLGPRTVNNNMTCAQNVFQKSLRPIMGRLCWVISLLGPIGLVNETHIQYIQVLGNEKVEYKI